MISQDRVTPNPDQLLQVLTPEYEPSRLIYGFWMSQRRIPIFTRWRDVEAMLLEPRVDIALSYIKGSVLSLSRFFVDEDNPEIKEFIVNQITRWWRTSAMKMLSALEWGYSGLEVLYVIKDGMVQFDNTKHFRATDVFPVTKEGSLCGLVANQRNPGSVTGHHDPKKSTYIGAPKSLWHVYRRERHPWYGQSRLQPAYSSWVEMTGEGGARDIRRLYFYKHAFQREKIYHPPGSTQMPDGSNKPNKDIAREIAENARAGGIYAFPSVFDPLKGGRLWEVEDGGMNGGAAMDVLNYPEELRKEMAEGIGVPTELIEAAETGSGYSGRRVPQDAFHGMLSDIVYWLVHDFNEQCIIPMLRLNLGVTEPTHEIIPFGMVEDPNELDEGTQAIISEEENDEPVNDNFNFSEEAKVITPRGVSSLPRSLFKDKLAIAV